jgi:hypothetical protein
MNLVGQLDSFNIEHVKSYDSQEINLCDIIYFAHACLRNAPGPNRFSMSASMNIFVNALSGFF